MSAKQILTVGQNDGEELQLHDDNISSILLSDDVMDKPVVLISVAGAFRTGKSFLLDLMARYLMASDKSDWLRERSARSFSWQSGCEAHTNGMFMSRPIPVRLQSGDEAVVILMDTQGTFDGDSTIADSAKLFALSTLTSSVQIYNVMNNLKSDDLDHLQLFAEYGRVAMDVTKAKPFQELVFLVRDWCHTKDHPSGAQGGKELAEKRLSGKREALAESRDHIKACFTDISGFLLPHPGATVASSATFDGNVKDMDPEFVRVLKELMPTLFSPESLTVKMNGDHPMTCRQLATHIRTYAEVFKSGGLPQPCSVLQAVTEADNLTAVEDEKLWYIKQMESLLDEDATMLDTGLLYQQHMKAKAEALAAFRLRKTMRNASRAENYYSCLLVDKIEEWFKTTKQCMAKCKRDMLKACTENERLVHQCIGFFDEVTKRVRSSLSLSVERIRETYQQARQQALDLFDTKKIVFGSYTASESRHNLEHVLEQRLPMLLECSVENRRKAKVKKILYIASAVVTVVVAPVAAALIQINLVAGGIVTGAGLLTSTILAAVGIRR